MATYSSKKYPSGSVTSATLADGTIVAVDLASDSVTSAKIADAAITNAKLAADGFDASKFTTGTLPIARVADGAVTAAKLSNAGAELGMRNRIINGDMRIDQRNAGASVTPANVDFTLDRWKIGASVASKFSVQQNSGSVTPPAGFINYLGCVSLSAYSVGSGESFFIRQQIEGLNTGDLAWGTASAATVTLSFWVRSSLTGTFGGVVKNSDATRSYPFSYAISSANTWEQKSVTIAGDTSGTWLTTNDIGIGLTFGLGVGSTVSGTAGAWAAANYNSATGATNVVATSGATFYITGVQLEKGSTATSFDYRPYGTELILAQRYYEETNNNRSVEFQIHATTNGLMSTRFLVRKRVSPTVTVFSSNTGVAGTVNNGNGNVQTGINGYAVYPDCFAVQMAGTVSQVYTYFFTASAEL